MSPRKAPPTVRDFNDTCTLCQQPIHPRDIMRLDAAGNCRCPHCGGTYCQPPRSGSIGMGK